MVHGIVDIIFVFTVKPVYKGHSREPENALYQQLPFIYRLKLYALFINGENKASLYIQ
jgi:hypothetical protein